MAPKLGVDAKMSEARWMDNPEQPDLVDDFYVPFVRALGNLVIMFAQAEASLLKLVAEMKRMDGKDADEKIALAVLKAKDADQQVIALVKNSGIEGFELCELIEVVGGYWSDKERRNRYMHDEWYPRNRDGGTAGTRGLPHKKGSVVVWDNPTPEDVWRLALRFRDHKRVFSHAAYILGKRADGEQT